MTNHLLFILCSLPDKQRINKSTSASTVKGFAESTRGADYTGLTAACIGKQTKAAADKLGMETYMAEKATIEHLIRLVEEIKHKKERE